MSLIAVDDLQTTAIVILDTAATRQKVLNAAESKQLVQLRLQEPEHAYGLKGDSTTANYIPHDNCAARSCQIVMTEVLLHTCTDSRGEFLT